MNSKPIKHDSKTSLWALAPVVFSAAFSCPITSTSQSTLTLQPHKMTWGPGDSICLSPSTSCLAPAILTDLCSCSVLFYVYVLVHPLPLLTNLFFISPHRLPIWYTRVTNTNVFRKGVHIVYICTVRCETIEGVVANWSVMLCSKTLKLSVKPINQPIHQPANILLAKATICRKEPTMSHQWGMLHL